MNINFLQGGKSMSKYYKAYGRYWVFSWTEGSKKATHKFRPKTYSDKWNLCQWLLNKSTELQKKYPVLSDSLEEEAELLFDEL